MTFFHDNPRAVVARACAGLVLVLLAFTGCTRPMPEHPVERSLYRDLRQIVETRERTGWLIDRSEVADLLPTAHQSVCQVTPNHREALIGWISDRIEALGGPAEEAWRARGRDLGEIDHILTLERMQALLVEADARAIDDCPFYIEFDPEFAGVQTSNNRFIILAESVGGLLLSFQEGEALLGAGGGGRLMPAWGVDEIVTLALGVEVGGNGSFATAERGEDDSVDATITGAVPFIVRLHDETWMYDIEVAGLTRWDDGSLTWPPGVRVAFGVGIGSVRIAGIMPQGLGWLGYEFYPEDDGVPETHLIRAGTRVGVDFDP